MSRVFICGDTHGDRDHKKLRSLRDSKIVDKNDYLIIAGDSAILFDQSDKGLRRQAILIDFYNHMPCNVLIVDGNHDNHDILPNLPKEDYGGGVVGRISENILHLKRGYVYEIGFHKFFIFGGALSPDKSERLIGIDWWPGELPTHKQTERGFDNLQAHNWAVDYVVTHTGPRTIMNYYGKTSSSSVFKDPTTIYLDDIFNKLTYRHWYFGHIHLDVTHTDGKISCLFNKIKEVEI